MKRKLTKIFTGVAVLSLLLTVSVFALPHQANVHAEDGSKSSTGSSTSSSGTVNSDSTGKSSAETSDSTTETDKESEDHLVGGKLTACQNRQNAVNNIISHIVSRATAQIAVFDAIATRTEAFYLKQGKTLANYNDLVAAVTAAKTKAETDLAAMKTTDNFNCTSNKPKGIVSAFQADLKLEIADLKAYRTAVKNLILGVKSVQGTTSSTENSQGGQQ